MRLASQAIFLFRMIAMVGAPINLFCISAPDLYALPVHGSDIAHHQINAEELEPGRTRVTYPERMLTVEPRFPEDAAEAGLTKAKVIIQLMVDKEGIPRQPSVLKVSDPDYGFEDAAIEAILKWRYKPATREGKPVAVYFTEVVHFRKGPTDA